MKSQIPQIFPGDALYWTIRGMRQLNAANAAGRSHESAITVKERNVAVDTGHHKKVVIVGFRYW